MTSEIRDVIELFTFGGCNSYAFKTIPSCRIASPGIFENNFSTLFFLKKIFWNLVAVTFVGKSAVRRFHATSALIQEKKVNKQMHNYEIFRCSNCS